jgi:hypothetical protein
VLLGGRPLSVTARTTRGVRDRADAATPMTADDVMARLLDQLEDEITKTRADLTAVGDRVERLCAVHDRLAEEFGVDEHLPDEFAAHDTTS